MSDYEQEAPALDDEEESPTEGDDDLLEAQEQKGYGEDEGEREESLDEQ